MRTDAALGKEQITRIARDLHDVNVSWVRHERGTAFPATLALLRQDLSLDVVHLDGDIINDDRSKMMLSAQIRGVIKQDPSIQSVILSTDALKASVSRDLLRAFVDLYGHVPAAVDMERIGLITRHECYMTHVEFKNTREFVAIETRYSRAEQNTGPILHWEETQVHSGSRTVYGRMSGFFLDPPTRDQIMEDLGTI